MAAKSVIRSIARETRRNGLLIVQRIIPDFTDDDWGYLLYRT